MINILLRQHNVLNIEFDFRRVLCWIPVALQYYKFIDICYHIIIKYKNPILSLFGNQ